MYVVYTDGAYSPITIYTDSMYVVGTMTMDWKRKCNIDLWKILDNLNLKHNVIYEHIKGHAGNESQEIADTLATESIRCYT